MNQIGKKTKVTILGYGEEKLDKNEFDNYKGTVDDRIKDTVKTINGVVPDENGNVIVDALDVDTSTFVKEINGVKPVDGKVSIPVPEVDTSKLATKTEVTAKADKTYVDKQVQDTTSEINKIKELNVITRLDITESGILTIDGMEYVSDDPSSPIDGGTFTSAFVTDIIDGGEF